MSEMVPLTSSGIRAATSVMVGAAVPDVPPHTASTVVDALDAVTRTLLVEVLGPSPAEAVAVLDYLWTLR